MRELYVKVREALEQGKTAVLATIVRQAGPAPRGLGAKCLLLEDGSLVETIGGGRLEALVLEEAGKVLKAGRPKRMAFVLQGTDVAGTDMLCGGKVEVLLEPLSAARQGTREVFLELLGLMGRGQAAVLATGLDEDLWLPDQAPRLLLTREGRCSGSVAGVSSLPALIERSLEQILRAGQPRLLTVTDDQGKEREVFLEPILAEPVVYVFGGGHVSKEIVPLAARVGFAVDVIDDREEFSHPGLFPEARSARRLAFEGVMEGLRVDEFSYLVIVTRGHIHDKTVLAQALRTRARYIGMIGSRRKRDMLYAALLEEGYTRADLARVHSPIGLAIGAETPAEIGVSIVAELIAVRAEKLP